MNNELIFLILKYTIYVFSFIGILVSSVFIYSMLHGFIKTFAIYKRHKKFKKFKKNYHNINKGMDKDISGKKYKDYTINLYAYVLKEINNKSNSDLDTDKFKVIVSFNYYDNTGIGVLKNNNGKLSVVTIFDDFTRMELELSKIKELKSTNKSTDINILNIIEILNTDKNNKK